MESHAGIVSASVVVSAASPSRSQSASSVAAEPSCSMASCAWAQIRVGCAGVSGSAPMTTGSLQAMSFTFGT
jgi:hypothetical protein